MTYAPDHARIATPIGMVRIWGDRETILRIVIESGPSAAEAEGRDSVVREAAAQLRAYFDGRLHDFDIPLIPLPSLRGQVLREGIAAIGYGETLSYGALARSLGSAPRAVGQACARNPYPLVIPCHRVLASGGKLGAYSAGEGPRTKQWLLDHETRHARKA